ncbi:PIN domain-containing protein [Vulcanisaeta sp. JCM 16161]|uniref:PIN domain-containing protein n=1 Tax=Vulcanisaeta sp. JCM 16161 TaxID=1295372 RepID=UPI0006D111D7|nr:PIN domain-containing protein [Vulcanisaeta sp. JCM 16161]
MKSQVIIDTNVLVYATFKDSEYHAESYDILQRSNVVIPHIVLYEYMWVLLKLTGDLGIVKVKLNELRDFVILHEDLDTIYNGLILMEQDKASSTMLNDYIILSVALRRSAYLATYDQKLRKIANKHGVMVIP